MGANSALQSMTAFGSAEVHLQDTAYVCELKSLNSRYLEVSVRLPRFLMALETEIIAFVKKSLARGKVDVVFNIQLPNSSAELPRLNPAAVSHYLDIYESIRQQVVEKRGAGLDLQPIAVSDFYQLVGVIEPQSRTDSAVSQVEKHRAPILDCLNAALKKLVTERAKEGEALHAAFGLLLRDLEVEHENIANIAATVNAQVYANYLKRLENLARKMSDDGLPSIKDLPEDRLLAEVMIMTDRCDIEEEITRLKTHIREFSDSLGASEPIGRKLDFLCQEMHREINTMSNKLVQSEATKHTMNLKQTVEKIRQQVQNIE